LISYDPRQQLVLAKALFSWVPHAGGQLDWLLDTSQTKVACCGRRWGKSESVATDILTFALIHKASRQILFAPSIRQLDPIWTTLKDYVGRLNAVHRGVCGGRVRLREKPDKQIVFPNGAMVQAFGVDPQSEGSRIRGFREDRAFLDEAAFIPEDIKNTVILPMLVDSGGQLVLISTPKGKNWFYDEAMAAKALKAFHCHSSFDNPHLDRSFLEKQCRDLGETSITWRTEYLAEFISNQGMVLSTSQIERAMRDDVPLHAPAPDRKYYAGIDVARTDDYLVAIVVDVTNPEFRVVDLDHFHGFDSWKEAADRIESLLRRWHAPALCDASSLSDHFAEDLHRRGLQVQPMKLNYWERKREIIDNLLLKFGRNELELPVKDSKNGKLLWDELTHYEYAYSPNSPVIQMRASTGHHDDCVIALALACFGCRTAPVAAREEDKPFSVEAHNAFVFSPEGWAARRRRERNVGRHVRFPIGA